MQRKLSVKTRVFLAVAACAVILVVWQMVAPPPHPPPATTELVEPLDRDRAEQGSEAQQQPEPWVQLGPYEFPRFYLLLAISLLVQLTVGAVVLTVIVIRRRTISCRFCHKSFQRGAPICTHCGREQ